MTLDTLTINLDDSTTYSINTEYASGSVTWNDYSEQAVQFGDDGITLKDGCDITVGDKSLLKAIENIESRLAILNTNPELEQEWDELKQLGDQYRKLEKQLLEKTNAWNILKGKKK